MVTVFHHRKLRGKGVGNWYSESKEVLTTHAADAGAMPWTAGYLVNGKGFGDPRQRG
jgi:hypothetical protein